MDKNKSRTDLLAAGRKKLEKFRQKKDNKGSNSKSSDKAGKSVHDASVNSTSEAAVTPQNVADGEKSKHDTQGTSALPGIDARGNLVTNDIITPIDELSGEAVILDKASPTKTAEIQSEDSVNKTSWNQSAGDECDIDSEILQTCRSSSLVPEDAKYFVSDSPNVVAPRENSPDSGIPMPADFTSQLERLHSEEQEVGCSSENQIDGGMAVQIEGDIGISPNDFTENAEKAIQLTEPDNTSLTVTNNDAEESQQGGGHSVGAHHLTESAVVSTVRSEVSGLMGEDVSSGLSDEKEKEMFDVSDVYGGDQGTQVNPEVIEERCLDSKNYGTTTSGGYAVVDLSSGLDGGLIKLSHLAEILQILDEDDFKFLFMSMSPEKFRDASNAAGHVPAVHDTVERLKEALYVASFVRDAFHLHLSEHQKSIDQDFVYSALLTEIQGKNEILEEGIGRCRDELLNVVSEKEELQKNLHFSNAEVEAVSAKANELQGKLEMTQKDMSSLSSELVDCRNLIASLQAETERCNGQLEMMNEETKKLLEDKENILLKKNNMMGQLAECKASLELLRLENVKLAENEALLRDGMRQLYDEKDYLVCEKNTLLADLKEHERTLESLEAENRHSHETLTSLSEEIKKLEEERELAVLQNVNLSRELTECNDLMVTLQAEISNLHGNLTSITEDKNKYEEERESILNQYEKQWHELMEIKILEAGLKSECSKVVDDLKKARIRISNLTEENETLKTDMEFHKSNTRDFDRERGFQEVANDSIRSGVLPMKKSRFVWHADKSSMEHMKLNFYDTSYEFMALKNRLEDAGAVLQNLEKAIEGMYLHVASLSRSNDKAVAPGVSRLIQAFESKNPLDDHPVEPASSEDQETEDPYKMTKNVVQTLGALIKELVLDAENATEVFVGVRKSKLHAITNLMSNYDYLRKHADLVEESIIEHKVVFEVMIEHTRHAFAKESDLLIQRDALQKQDVILKLENSRLREKLIDFQTKTMNLQNKLDDMYRDSDDIAASISHEIKIFQAELVDRETILEEEWKSVIVQVFLAVDELDSTIKTFDSASVAAANSESSVVSHISTSAFGAIEVIKDLNGRLEAAERNRQVVSNAYDDLLEKWSNLQGKYEMAIVTLHRLYSDLSELVNGEIEKNVKDYRSLDILHPEVFTVLLDQCKRFLGERLQLESANKQLISELMTGAKLIDALEKKCDKLNTLIELVEDIEQSVVPEGTKSYADEPIARLETMICLLVQKYKETEQSFRFSSSLQEQVEGLNFTLVQYENENLVFEQSLRSADDHIVALNSKVQEMVTELEQSEHRVSSLREKLGIAVTKGKALILQRDSLKQSLAETSQELDKCSQELLTKDTIVHDLETKLKVYSEAGERMEALESELSYIRNSSTALRESFLLKDSVLQRIEEILEDLELPEHFHARDIIEKIDFLAKSVTGSAAHLGEWDQRSSVGGGSYSDTGFVGADGLKDEMQLNINYGDDLRRRYEELQSKFYDLAEQNEMLEQSLMLRNNIVQRWEEIFDRIDMPSQMRSMEPEDKILWFERVLAEAQSRCNSLQEKIDKLESHCESLTAEMQDKHGRISELGSAFQQACREKEILSRDLELCLENTETSKKTFDLEIRNGNLQNEVSMLQDQKLHIEKEIHRIESVMSRMQDLVKNALRDSSSEDLADAQEEIKSFEELLSKLVENYIIMLSGKPVNSENVDVHVTEKGEVSHISRNPDDQEVAILSKKLEDLLGELACLKDEKDSYVLKNQSLVWDVEELQSNKNELRELLNQEEHKSASLKEKLNVAVRKGKSLVQQRDGMKQVIEELNTKVEHLKSEISHNENTISEYGTRINELSTLQERVPVLESENTSLMSRLAETERHLQVKDGTLSSVLDALGDVDIGLTINSGNPIEKLKEIETNFHDMRMSLNFVEQESRKSKRAAELLLAELNEVQERSDVLQEELSNAADELSKISKEKESAEGSKYEALAGVEKLSSLLEEKERQLSEVMVLSSGVDQLREGLFAFESGLCDVLSKDREVLHNMANIMKSVFESGNAFDLSARIPSTDDIISNESENKSFLTEIGSLNEQLHKHSLMLHEEICYLSEVMRGIHREFVSQKELNESIRKDVKKLELMAKERESEIHSLHENVSLLSEACVGAIFEIEKWKDLVNENCSPSRDVERNMNSQIFGGYGITDDIRLYTTEGIRSTRDKLLLAVRDCTSMQTELNEVGLREMKNTIVSLQKELQEKDIQRDKICKELVNQIKEAETNAKNYLQDLQQARAQLHDLQRQVVAKEDDRKVLEQRLKKLQDQETNCLDLQKKLNALTDALAAKEQETEALMQALDEEESQIEDQVNKIGELENELKQKNQDLENLETSRTKTLKKLSVTVSKFDELHSLSENLLSEVENLQSQLQERDTEISFLRQEVTRCTNDALNVTQTSKKNSDEIHYLLTWLDTLISPEKSHDGASDDIKSYRVNNEYEKVLRKQIMALVSELENLRLMAKNSDVLLQKERSKVDELAQKQWYLENSLRNKESEIVMLQDAGDSAKPKRMTSEIVEVEPITNRASPRTIAPQVRSLRKTNNDQVAIAIDVNHSDDKLELDDDDKAHGFKSLTTSKIVPRFTRPVSDLIDGLWVSCDRALMRRPALRLGIIIYWAVLHALLANFVV